MTKARLLLAIVSTVLEEVAIYLVWRWVLPGFGINLAVWVLAVAMAVWALFSVFLFLFTTRVLRRQAMVGLPSMVGSRGRTAGPLAPEGQVKIRGEIWGVVSQEGDIAAGEEIEVTGEDGLKLVVRRCR